LALAQKHTQIQIKQNKPEGKEIDEPNLIGSAGGLRLNKINKILHIDQRSIPAYLGMLLPPPKRKIKFFSGLQKKFSRAMTSWKKKRHFGEI
jgi:hypothetical protein